MGVCMGEAFTGKRRLEFLVAAFTGLDKLTIRRDQRLAVLVLCGLAGGYTGVR